MKNGENILSSSSSSSITSSSSGGSSSSRNIIGKPADGMHTIGKDDL